MKKIRLHQRLEKIVEQLEIRGSSSYDDLQRILGVSGMTVRRDVDALVLSGRAIKTLRGIARREGADVLTESPVLSRLDANRNEKRAIAKKAAALIKPDECLYVDGGTTCMEFAKALVRAKTPARIVTNSILVAAHTYSSDTIQTILLGGTVEHETACASGTTTEEMARSFFVDTAVISTLGFLPAEGTFESAFNTLQIKQQFARQSGRVILLLDHTKFGRKALCKVVDIAEIDIVVTDRRASKSEISALRKKKKTVLLT